MRQILVSLSDAFYLRDSDAHLFRNWLAEALVPRPPAPDEGIPSIEDLNAQHSNAVLFEAPPAPQNFVPPPYSAPMPTIDEAALIERLSNAVLARLGSMGYGAPRLPVVPTGELGTSGVANGPFSRAVRRFGG